jgi:hypothetical protein
VNRAKSNTYGKVWGEIAPLSFKAIQRDAPNLSPLPKKDAPELLLDATLIAARPFVRDPYPSRDPCRSHKRGAPCAMRWAAMSNRTNALAKNRFPIKGGCKTNRHSEWQPRHCQPSPTAPS